MSSGAKYKGVPTLVACNSKLAILLAPKSPSLT